MKGLCWQPALRRRELGQHFEAAVAEAIHATFSRFVILASALRYRLQYSLPPTLLQGLIL